MNSKAKRITTIAMLCAVSYAVMAVGRVPVVLFLKYDPKDVIITLGGLIWGPFTAFIVSVIVSFIEMLSVSDTGIIGCVMNILSTCAFACTASIIYKKWHSLAGAAAGLLLPAFLPFNLIKSGLNAAFTFLLYKPVITALRKSGYLAASGQSPRRRHVGMILFSVAVILTCILLILSMNGIL